MLRRTILSRLAGSFMLLGLAVPTAGKVDAAETVLFRDDGRANWQQLFKKVGPTCTKVAREGKRLRVTSCSVGGTGNRTAMAWALPNISAPGIRIDVDYTHHTATPAPDGTMTGMMILAKGEGSSGYPVDVTKWSAQCCAGPTKPTVGYAHHMSGLQLNFAYRHDPRGNDFIRLRGLKGTAGSYELFGEAAIPMVDGRAYHLTIIRAGAALTVRVQDKVTGTTKSFTASHPYIDGLGSGWVGYRQMAGRSSSFANLKVATGG